MESIHEEGQADKHGLRRGLDLEEEQSCLDGGYT